MVGAYGNSWIRTRRLDRLACESFVFDQALIDSPQLARLYRAYWLGVPGGCKETLATGGTSLLHLLSASGWHTSLVTDEIEVASLLAAADFAERIVVEPPKGNRTAADESQTQLARLFAAATTWLQTASEPFCLWVHAQGMGGAWDAPLELRNQYADDEDPKPPRFVSTPNRRLPDVFDPDELLGIVHAYAGQVTLLDRHFGAFCDALDESAAAPNTQLTLLGARGFPLGEHLRVGPCDEALYNETVQIPWLMRFPDRLGSLARSQALARPADLPGTLLEWLGLDGRRLGTPCVPSLLGIVRGEFDAIREAMLMVSRHDRAIRTPAWHLRQPDAGPPELYAKPSDRWEVNEVARLLPDIAIGLQAALAELEQADEGSMLSPLAEALITEVD